MVYCQLGLGCDVRLEFNGLRFCFIAKKPDDLQTTQMFSTLGLELAISNLMRLKKEGYRFPQEVLDKIYEQYRELQAEEGW